MADNVIDFNKAKAAKVEADSGTGTLVYNALEGGHYKCAVLATVDGDGDPGTAIFHIADELKASEMVCLMGALEMAKSELIGRLVASQDDSNG